MRDAREVAIIDVLPRRGRRWGIVDVKLVCINNYLSACSSIELKYCITYIFIDCTLEGKDKRQGVPGGGGAHSLAGEGSWGSQFRQTWDRHSGTLC
jgi:hypothetical protein